MKRDAYLGLDIGGTGAKAGVMDASGRVLGVSQRPYHPQLTADGHVEIPIDTIYSATREAAVAAIRESESRIVALAISSQGQTFVSLDNRDQPLHPAIVWYDARAAPQAQFLDQSLKSSCLSEPLPDVTPIASGPKVMWLREHFPEVMSRATRYLLLPDYFAYRLTRHAVIDPSTASSTALYAEDAADYCAAALEAAGIRKGEIAEIRPTGHPVARVVAESASEWGLDSDTLVVAGANDQYAGALGAGNCRPGIVSLTSGTALALVTLT
jgi:xylulokinase